MTEKENTPEEISEDSLENVRGGAAYQVEPVETLQVTPIRNAQVVPVGQAKPRGSGR